MIKRHYSAICCVFMLGLLSQPMFADTTVDQGKWRFYLAPSDEIKFINYMPMAKKSQSGYATYGPRDPKHSVPNVIVKHEGTKIALSIRPESDKNAWAGRGLLIASWRCPADGNWKIDFSCKNVGMDVTGGDGGVYWMSIFRKGDKYDVNRIWHHSSIPTSSRNPKSVDNSGIYILEKGDRILFHFGARIDGYGDRFIADIDFKQVDEKGVKPTDRGLDNLIPNPADKQRFKGAEFKKGMFWLGCGGGWLEDESSVETAKYILKFIPSLAMIGVNSFPERTALKEWFKDNGIPTMAQTWGSGYESYLRAHKAFEINQAGVMLDRKYPMYTLSGCAHAAALPHPKTREAYKRLSQASIRQGHSAQGYCDLVWMWGGGRGKSGYNPETIKAFQQDLLGKDEGLSVSLDGGEPKTYMFADYAKYYIGSMLKPADMGLTSWEGYRPAGLAKYNKMTGKQKVRHDLLFDLLCHYEWLKFAQFLGVTAEKEGGVFQCMPNPEDLANGSDFLFAAANTHIFSVDEEFFQSPEYLDGAYFRFPYLRKPSLKSKKREVGIVLEAGHGGNGWPYYDIMLSYALAYEVTAATQCDHVEADFWPAMRRPMADTLKNENFHLRAQQIMAYGMGFKDAYADQVERLKPDFISVSSRRIFRPWGTNWRPWDWKLDVDGSADLQLAQSGYVFEGIGEDGLDRITTPQKLVVYAPSVPTQKGLDTITKMMDDGRIENCIIFAPFVQKMISYKFIEECTNSLYPAFAAKFIGEREISGRLCDVSGKPVSKSFSLAGQIYSVTGANVELSMDRQPLVAGRKVGKATLYILLFDPTTKENADLAGIVLSKLNERLGIPRYWDSINGSMTRLYRKGDMRIAGVQNIRGRNWGKFLVDRPDKKKGHYMAYKIKGATAVRIKEKPNTTFDWVALPSGQQGQATSDTDGWLRLTFKGTSHEIFFYQPAGKDKSRLEEIKKRSEALKKAISFQGV